MHHRAVGHNRNLEVADPGDRAHLQPGGDPLGLLGNPSQLLDQLVGFGDQLRQLQVDQIGLAVELLGLGVQLISAGDQLCDALVGLVGLVALGIELSGAGDQLREALVDLVCLAIEQGKLLRNSYAIATALLRARPAHRDGRANQQRAGHGDGPSSHNNLA